MHPDQHSLSTVNRAIDDCIGPASWVQGRLTSQQYSSLCALCSVQEKRYCVSIFGQVLLIVLCCINKYYTIAII